MDIRFGRGCLVGVGVVIPLLFCAINSAGVQAAGPRAVSLPVSLQQADTAAFQGVCSWKGGNRPSSTVSTYSAAGSGIQSLPWNWRHARTAIRWDGEER